MNKIICKENLKKILIIFLLLQPLLDTYILFEEKAIEIFTISPSTIIRLICIFIIGIFSIVIIKSKRKWLNFIIYILMIFMYSVIHIYNAKQFVSLTPGNFNFSIITEIFYIIRLIIPFMIIFVTSNIRFDKKKIKKVLNILICIFSITIVITNIFKISVGAYITKPIGYNIFDWFTKNIHNTHSFYDTATRGYFSFANMISSLMFGFTSILFYRLIKNFNYKTISMLIIQMLAMFMLGTKVATFGFVLSLFAMSVVYIYFCFIKKEIKFNYKIPVVIVALTISWGIIYPYSPCKNRINITNESEIIKEELTVKDFSKELENLTEKEKGMYVSDYVLENYEAFGIKEEYILKKYPYENDAFFWYQMFSEPSYVKSDNRKLMGSIIERLKYLNDRKTMDELFGLTYSRVSNIATLEKDFVYQYHTLGLVGFILLILPYIILLISCLFKMIFNINKITLKNVSLVTCLLSALAGAYYCGNSLDNLTFSIIIAFIYGILLNNLNYKKEKIKEDEITILALHLGYGGVEKYISSLCKMLENNYKINIITTYKMLDKPAFYFDDKIKITYLMKEKPNKEEFKEAIRSKNIIKILQEGFKSIKILYLRKSKNIEAIKNIDSKYIITTRTFHNNLVSKYANSEIIKIATEHNFHNNDKKYINNLVKSLKRFNYLVVVSNTLKEFYKNKIGNTECIYIPNVIDNLPNKYTNLKENNLINIGRLEYEKAHTDLIDIIYDVKKEIPNIKLYLIGDGSKRPELENKIKSLSLEDNIILTGYLDQKEMEKYLIKSKLFVLTSLTESFGLVLIEAMSYKVPCIAYDSADGAKELLKNGNGVLIKDRNKKLMVKEIIELLNDKNKLNKLSETGHLSCKKYLIDNVAKQWLELLNKE